MCFVGMRCPDCARLMSPVFASWILGFVARTSFLNLNFPHMQVAELIAKKKAAAEVKFGPCVGIYGVPGLGEKPSNYHGCDVGLFVPVSDVLSVCTVRWSCSVERWLEFVVLSSVHFTTSL